MDRGSTCLSASLLLILACGDSGGRGSDSAAATTSGATLPTTLTASDPTTSATGDGTGSASATTGGSNSNSDSDSDSSPVSQGSGGGEPKFDQGTTPDFSGTPGCGDSGGEPDTMFSYIWIANSGQGTVSKIDSLIAANSGVYARIQRVG